MSVITARFSDRAASQTGLPCVQVQSSCARDVLGTLSWQGLVQQLLFDTAGAAGASGDGAAAPAAPLDYWALAPGARVCALRRLCHAALDTPVLRYLGALPSASWTWGAVLFQDLG